MEQKKRKLFWIPIVLASFLLLAALTFFNTTSITTNVDDPEFVEKVYQTIKTSPPLAYEGLGSLFDVILTVPEGSRFLLPGQDLLISMELINFGESGETDVSITYIVVGENKGEIVYIENEDRVVETQDQFLKTLEIQELPYGNYNLYAYMLYDNSSATASGEFSVVTERDLEALRN